MLSGRFSGRDRSWALSMKPLLTLQDLSPLLKRSVATLRSDRSRSPHLLPPAIMIGRTPRFRPEDVEAWIAALPSGPLPLRSTYPVARTSSTGATRPRSETKAAALQREDSDD